MINRIFYEGNEMLDTEKCGKFRYCIFTEDKIPISKIKEIKIECHKCNKLSSINMRSSLLKNKYICMSCNKTGDRNPFFNKKHSEEFKQKLSNERRGKQLNPNVKSAQGWLIYKHGEEEGNRRWIEQCKSISIATTGENNHFYGKHHTDESKAKLQITSRAYWDSLNEEEKQKVSDRCRQSQQNQKDENLEKYINDRKRANRVSLLSQNRKYKINKIEKIVQDELQRRNLNFIYSVILGYKQFDFGNKELRILLEVQGDYWHGNPKIYSELNHIQIRNKQRDNDKYEFVQRNNMKLFYIWEQDILLNDFTAIDKIEEYINEIRTG